MRDPVRIRAGIAAEVSPRGAFRAGCRPFLPLGRGVRLCRGRGGPPVAGGLRAGRFRYAEADPHDRQDPGRPGDQHHPAPGRRTEEIRRSRQRVAGSAVRRDLFLEYTTDTLPGSSGSPAFNKDWEVVALHHSGVPEIRDGGIMTISGTPWRTGMPDSDIHWVANEGVRVSRICAASRASARCRAARHPRWPSLVRRLRTTSRDCRPSSRRREASAVGRHGVPARRRDPQACRSRSTAPRTSTYGRGPAPDAGRLGGAPAAAGAPPPVTAAPAVEKKLRFDPDYDARPGYDRDFLGMPRAGAAASRRRGRRDPEGRATRRWC